MLRSARLVDAEKRGLYVEYRLADEDVCRFFVSLRQLATSRLAEINLVTRAFRERRGALEEVHGQELLRRVRSGEVTILDVRPVEEYEAGHIPGAVSMPIADLRTRWKDLPRDREVVAYCRGPYCVMAVDAVTLLREQGFRAHRLEVGVADWRARGWRIATTQVPRRAPARVARPRRQGGPARRLRR